jgi:hypothetical protein
VFARSKFGLLIIPGSLVYVALKTQCLKVSQIVCAAVFSRNDMVDLDGSHICRNAAELAAEARALQYLVPDASRDVAECGSAVVVDGCSAFLKIGADRMVAEPN